MSHFEHLTGLIELERAEQRRRFEEDRQRFSLQERAERGVVELDVESADESVGLGGRVLLWLERAGRQPFRITLHPGDLVALRPRKAEVDQPATAVVSRVGRIGYQVAFDREPPPFVREGRLLLELLPNDVTFDRARSAVQRVAAMDRGVERRRREVLLGNEPPRFDPLREVTLSRPLNPEQHEAVQRALSAQDFFLVHGPPGTGKSTVLAELAVQAVARGQRLLGTAASNAAVDHLLDLCLGQGLRAIRVGHPARVSPRLQEHTLDLLVEEHPDRKLALELFDEAFDLLGYARKQRRQGRSRERFANARESQAEARKLLDEARALERRAVRSVLERAQVVCATCTSLDSGPLAGEQFELALLDEATQAIEPVALMAFLKAPTVILAGDHQQLPPTVISLEASRKGLSRSLFERVLAQHGEGVKKMLREQYRMSEELMAFPSREMYAGELRAHPSVAGRRLAEVLGAGFDPARPEQVRVDVDAPPFLFIDTAGKGFDEEVQPQSESLFNPGEADLVAGWARALLGAGLAPSSLAVISPYRAQVEQLRQRLPDTAVEIDSVDAFQGREKDAVLVSLVRSSSGGQLGFLEDLRRINVALTRAKRHLLVVGDSATLSSNPFYVRLIDRAHEVGGYRSAWEWSPPG